MTNLQDILQFKLISLENYSLQIVDILMTVVVVLITYLILRSFNSVLRRMVKVGRLDERNRQSFRILFKYFIFVISFVLILQSLGVNVTILLAGSTALLVGVGFGLQHIFSDIIAGVFLLLDGSVKIGDIMEVDGIVGKVVELNLRTSEILSRDDIIIIVPNHKFIDENVVNWSHMAVLTRFDIMVGVAYGSDPHLVKTILLACAEEHSDVKVTKTKTPIVQLRNFGDSSLDFQLHFWSKNVFGIENTKSDIRFMILEKFAAKGIEIPFPQRDLNIKSGTLK